ncbi:MAG: sensor domain-containing diguanylate cyclase [Acidobacteriota bacterium]
MRQSLEQVRVSKERLERQNDVLRRIARGAPLAETLNQLALAIEDPGTGMFGSILLLDREGAQLATAAAPHLPQSFSRAIDGVRIGPSVGSCGTAAFRGTRVVVTDIQRDPLWADYRELAAAHGLRACWSQPIVSSAGAVLGTLAMYYPKPRSPTEAEIHLIETAADIAAIAIEAAGARDRLVHSTLHDPLTGLPNRILFLDRLGMALKRFQRREDALFAVLFVDIDLFKRVNDNLGHMAGDELLRKIAERLNRCLRPVDTVARMGGDEFAMLLDYLEEKGQASKLALRIHHVFEAPFDLDGQEVRLSVSIGITLSSPAYDRPEDLLRDADSAMYQAKTEGPGRQAVFDPATPRSIHRPGPADRRGALELEKRTPEAPRDRW